jgi:hypothetical protein
MPGDDLSHDCRNPVYDARQSPYRDFASDLAFQAEDQEYLASLSITLVKSANATEHIFLSSPFAPWAVTLDLVTSSPEPYLSPDWNVIIN